MHLTTRNVNTAFRLLIEEIQAGQKMYAGSPPVVSRSSRNGPVLMIDEPVTITYTHPRERVLFNAARDANPFFHLYEALWMLAGRNDVGSVAYYAKNMLNYSDDGRTLNGAYGYRWRRGCDNALIQPITDQLDAIVNHLKADPTSRRAVLQMWNVEDDLLKIDESRDVCCNLSVMFSIREGHLDMTVTNRSNDMIWGLLGANYVHFTVLLEYLAARLGAEVGRYHHFSNNLHVYESNWEPKEWLTEPIVPYPYPSSLLLVRNPGAFEKELPAFVEMHSGRTDAANLEDRWTEPFLSTVAGPMLTAFACHKEKDDHSAFMALDDLAADDWQIAAELWLKRRVKNHVGK